MTSIRVTHLIDDTNFGGVMRGLRMFDRPEFARIGTIETIRVEPRRRLSPRYPADLIVTHFAPCWAMIPFLWSLKLRHPRARLVHVEHSYIGCFEAAQVPNRTRFRTMLALALAPFDEVVCVSDAQAGWMRAAVPSVAARTHVINPWGSVSGLDAVAPVAHATAGPLVLAAYGRFDPIKRFDVLIAAMRRLPPDRFRLVLGGFGPEDAALRAAAEGLSHVTFAGRVEDVPGFLGGCDAVVIPSRWETFGQVAEEAKAAARPIVVADGPALAAHIGQAGLVVDCSDPATLARTLALLPTLPLRRMGEAGRASLATAAADRVAQWLALYERAVPRLASLRAAVPIRMSPGQIR
ncbi:glycosyltransferase family 4 protein [Sphingomonas sp. SUN039]|uniref:glycosyltransferase family 4 protein n=1 Tax=Sphingomonas sp. SUN039 TaxID=2937787 RepID=UPI0021642CA3|nr:glycosyltransferase family 4 protein [Sphingomonas sp. SUN039]UVO52752.1 glycosyltransferase family 4 protein [Sphingomonas sp. SUN039]